MNLYSELCAIAGGENVLRDEPMSAHTTFRIGGPADYFVTPGTPEEIAAVTKLCQSGGIPYYIIGNGSNLLVGDKGFRGVIIQVYKNRNAIRVEGNEVHAQAGALLSKVAAAACQAGLAGLEFASGIPGTVGGAVRMNAGAYGGEMKDILESVTVLDDSGQVRTLDKSRLRMGYRTSVVKEKGYVVLGARLRLTRGDKEQIAARMEELKKKRVEKQPLEYPSAGSTFKRPEGYFAGKLIMDCGLRGYRVGGAQVSTKHCGFVINAQDATAADVLALIRDIQDKVYEKFQVKLETEIRFLGDF